MDLDRNSKLLRIFLGDSDKIGLLPVYEKIFLEAKQNGLVGTTVFKAFMRYGQSSGLHTTKILRLSEDLPIVNEIVDIQEKINSFILILDKIFEEAKCARLVNIEKAEVIKYTGKK